MTTTPRPVSRLLNIHLAIQFFLLALLIYMSFNFQALFRAKGMPPQVFVNSILTSLALLLIVFYPISRFASSEAAREIASSAADLTPEQLKGLRQKRLYGDIIKASVFAFFAVFILLSPPATAILSTAFFSFVLTTLCYFQCFNFAARRALKS